METSDPATISVKNQGTSILRKKRSLRVSIKESMNRPSVGGVALENMKAHYDGNYALVGGRVVEVIPTITNSSYAPGSVAKQVWRELGLRDLRHLYQKDPEDDTLPSKVSYGFKLVGVDICLCILWNIESVTKTISAFTPEGLFHIPHRVILSAISRTSLDHDMSARLADFMAVTHRGFAIDACRIEPVKGELHALIITTQRFANVTLEFMSLSSATFPIWINLGLSAELASDPITINKLEDHIVNHSLLGFIEGEPLDRITLLGMVDSLYESSNPLYNPDFSSNSMLTS